MRRSGVRSSSSPPFLLFATTTHFYKTSAIEPSTIQSPLSLLKEIDMKFWTGFVTPHVRESSALCLELFGCKVVYASEDDWFVPLELNGSELAFMKPAQESQALPFIRPYTGQGAWIAVDVSDVDAHHARICEMGVPV